MSNTYLRGIMRAEMSPDCYGGKTCDQIVPRWHGHCDGEDSEHFSEPIKLDARQFPPGTIVTVQEPTCPECGSHREPDRSRRKWKFPDKCDCGFDWKTWTLEKYS